MSVYDLWSSRCSHGTGKDSLGVTSHGARRWLKLGVQFQPAEIAKIAVIITLSYLIVKMGKRVETLKATMVLLGMGGIQALFAYVFTDNLSTAMIILGITVGLVFIAHPKTKPFVILAVVAVILVAILVYSLSHMDQSSNFRLRRIRGMASSGGLCKRRWLSDSAGFVCNWFREVSLAEVLETVFRSLEVCTRHRMT
ncbi:MAG: FtsW/RodA/SpoVE family cell cycle protein [Ruminococcus sp.]